MEKHKVRAIVFDLDGTLVDSIYSIHKSVNEALTKFYGEPNQLPLKTVMSYVGNGSSVLLRRVLDLPADGELTNEQRECMMKFVAIFLPLLDRYSQEVQLFPGIKEMLIELHNKGLEVGVATNKPHSGAAAVFSNIMHEIPFDLVYQGVVEGVISPKPSPDIVEKVLGRMNNNKPDEEPIRKAEICFVGDSDVDIMTAKNIGCISIGCGYGYRPIDELQKAGADYIVNSVQELRDTLISLCK